MLLSYVYVYLSVFYALIYAFILDVRASAFACRPWT